MSLWNDFWEFVDDTVDDVGDTIQNAWDSVKANPIGAITSAVAMAYGIPPMWAGALGGAAGAAATGGNVVKAAITGGAMGSIGAYAGSAAGAATGSLGPIAQAAVQAAAAGGAAGVTGAVLTGQDVVTALKSGLILGAVTGGGAAAYKFMTPSEAISSVPKDVLARANLTSDPIAALNQEMGWTASESAAAAAQQAINQAKANGTLKQTYSDMIPDDVIAKAKTTANPAQSVANQMGWSMSGPQVTGIYDALNSFDTLNTPAKAPVSDATSKTVEQIRAETASNSYAQAHEQLAAAGKGTVVTTTDASGNTVYEYREPTGPIRPTEVATDTTTTPAPVNPATTVAQSTIPSIDSMWAKYDATDTFNPASNDISSMNLNSDSFADNVLKDQYGSQINNGVVQNAGNPNSAYAKNLTAAEASSNPEQFLLGKGYNQATVDQLLDYYDAQQYAQSQYKAQTVAEAYTPEQEARYNELVKSGMRPADAINQIGPAAPTAPVKVDVAGGAGFSENPSSVVPEYRTPNTDLATQQQIDSGTAQYNAGANAWEVPTSAPQQPIVPIIVPPTTAAPAQPAVQPPAPVAPPAVQPPVVQPPSQTPTTISSTTRTTPDGAVYKDDKQSDGTTISVMISGPTTAGTGTGGNGTGTGTVGNGTGPVAPPATQPPLTEGPRVVIPETPPIPEVQVPGPTTTTDPTTPTTPTDPTNPVFPVVVPTDPNNPDGSYHYGRYTLGQGAKLNVPTGLNPGWISPTPMYQPMNDAQSQFHWGGHPYQQGPEFNAPLYNNVPAAPTTPWGANTAQTSATPQQILAAMQGRYPLLGTTSAQAAGPVAP